ALGGDGEDREACVEWMFGPRQGDWLESAMGFTDRVRAAWCALDNVLSEVCTVVVASRSTRGCEYSSVWGRPDGLVWAKKAKNQYWPAMRLWGRGTNPVLADINSGRVPPRFREELDKQARGKDKEGIVVEFFGAHNFALMRQDAVVPLTTTTTSPNPKPPRHKRWDMAIAEATEALAALEALHEDMVEPLTDGERGRSLGFVTSPELEVWKASPDTDTDTSSGESVSGSDSDSPSASTASNKGRGHLVLPSATTGALGTGGSVGAAGGGGGGAGASSWAALGAPAPPVSA
ncbi:unnamed protein product, partial [Choristocarpus tenellus]